MSATSVSTAFAEWMNAVETRLRALEAPQPVNFGLGLSADAVLVSPPPAPVEPTVTITPGVNLSMPSWVAPASNSGFFSSNANIATSVFGQPSPFYDLRLSWAAMNPAQGSYNWNAIDTALASGRPIWLRLFCADSLHVPTWVKNANPSIGPLRWQWGGVPYTDIVNNMLSAGDFYPVWRQSFATHLATFLKALGDSGKLNTSQVKFAYFPGFYLWGEYTLHFLQSMNDAGFTPAQYTAWLKSHFNNFAYAMGGHAGKVVFTAPGHNEWIEPNTNWSTWNQEVNEADGVMARSKHMKWVIDVGGGARSGYTEAYNGYADACNWGTRRVQFGSYYHSTHDEAHPLADAAANGRVFGTEQEDFGSGGSFLDYWNAYCCTLALRMNWVIPYEQNNVPHTSTGLYNWVRLNLGKTRANAAEAFCRLRQYQTATNMIWGRYSSSLVEFNDSATVFRNFERWLIQRDQAGGVTQPTDVVVAGFSANSNGTNYEALRTDPATGNNFMYFWLDDVFHSGQTPRVLDIYVTFRDTAAAPFTLNYKSTSLPLDSTPQVTRTTGNGYRTAIFRISDGVFDGSLTGGADFRLNDLGSALTVRMVRVVKVNAP